MIGRSLPPISPSRCGRLPTGMLRDPSRCSSANSSGVRTSRYKGRWGVIGLPSFKESTLRATRRSKDSQITDGRAPPSHLYDHSRKPFVVDRLVLRGGFDHEVQASGAMTALVALIAFIVGVLLGLLGGGGS